MSEESVDVAVIGAGAMGAATAWQLARRGVSVEVFEQFEPGHVRGASHGASRNFNVAYDEATYLTWLREARVLWRELEDESSAALLTVTGIVTHGGSRDLESTAAAIRAGGFDADLLDAGEAHRRWPGIRFDGPVLHTPDAGRLHADASVAALLGRVEALGGRVHGRTRVEDLDVRDDDHVAFRAVDESGERRVRARRVVTTAGAWTSRVLGTTDAARALPRLRVTQEQPAHFAPRDAATVWPGFNHLPAPDARETAWFPAGIYGMFTPGEGVKAGWHAAGPETDPDRRSFTPDPALTAALVRYAREWLPGVDPDDFSEITCTYTSTPDSRFVLDRFGPVVVGAGFSGHGFKFTPVIGRILADAVVRD
ncbi:FAD-dependent oxidoreductase [Microbacterium sp. HMWF026]|uniref:FAD-dependent oxidoreductase n=1 Tax=Microbacterium sp. HMWF026 TaxID=2056861 RepID=UPI000D37D9BA|nr:FAD-dependent oxidoreductase [Microbacterium sp. HMWF026]PTT15986.1 FAD-dependent oxidoreductase [Microbacterium sp. HMWF026]